MRIAPQGLVGTCLLGIAGLGSTHAEPKADGKPVVTEVYSSNFAEAVEEDVWNKTETLKLGNETLFVPGWYVKFSQSDLPKHQFVRARISLTILGTFDGSDPVEGPDDWCVLLEGGTLLYLTNFRNAPAGDQRGVNQGIGQAFPDEFPGGLHPSGTGAKVVRNGAGLESHYDFEIVFPHSEPELVLQIQDGMHKHGDPRQENWGFRSLKLEVVSAPVQRDGEQMAALWKQLVGVDPVVASEAVWGFVASGAAGAEYVRKSATSLAEEEDQRVQKRLLEFKAEVDELAELVDSEVFNVRQAALEDLTDLHADAIPLLKAKLEEDPSPELKNGILGALRVIRKRPANDGETRQRTAVQSRVDHVLRIHDRLKTERRITASESLAPLAALDDGFIPKAMNGTSIPRFDWWGAKGGKEGWVQYEFPKAKTLDSAEVFWFVNPDWDKGAKLPASWSLSYRDGKLWKPVKVIGNYGITHGKIDRVEFDPVETTAIRLTAKSNENRIGLFEFRLGEKKD